MPRTTKNGQIHVVRIMQGMNDKFLVIQEATTVSARMLGFYQFAKVFYVFSMSLHQFVNNIGEPRATLVLVS